MKPIISLFLVVVYLSADAQNITQAFQLCDSILLNQLYYGDIKYTSEVQDLKNGYYSKIYSENNSTDSNQIHLLESAIFNNKDHSKLLFISVYNADEQCSWYTHNVYEIDQEGTTCKALLLDSVVPQIEWTMVCDSEVIAVSEIYLPTLQGSYLSQFASINELLSEFYSFQFSPPRLGTELKVSLHVCDYIPTNEISIQPNHWNLIRFNKNKLYLKYNKRAKRFEFQ